MYKREQSRVAVAPLLIVYKYFEVLSQTPDEGLHLLDLKTLHDQENEGRVDLVLIFCNLL